MKRFATLALALPLAIALCSQVRAEEPAFDFDQGIDIQTTLETLKNKPADDIIVPKVKASTLRTERDCVTVSFAPEDPLKSERIYLRSQEYQERCYTDGNGHRHCREELAYTYRANVRVEITDRGEMLPWERDVFYICLDARWLEGDVIDASHKYDLDWEGRYEATLKAKALHKIKALPDPNGIKAPAPRYDAGADNFVMELTDRWAGWYKGETTVLKVLLKRNIDLWFDPTIVEKEITLPTAAAHTVRFADYLEDFSGKLKDGKKYYVKWRFKRVSQISRDKWTRYRETGKTEFGKTKAIVGPSSFGPDLVSAARKVCWIKAIEKDTCVYKCSDKTEYKQPVATPDPFRPDEPVIACPQLVFPF